MLKCKHDRIFRRLPTSTRFGTAGQNQGDAKGNQGEDLFFLEKASARPAICACLYGPSYARPALERFGAAADGPIKTFVLVG